MPVLDSIIPFVIASVALLIIPGPAVIFIINRSVADGRTIGLCGVAGIELGTLMHIFAATAGLSAALATSQNLFNAIKWVGAGYLVFVGLRTLTRRQTVGVPSAVLISRGSAKLQAFRQGFVVNILNPKVALFFLSFLPQFIDTNNGSQALQAFILGLIFVTCACITDGIYSFTASFLRETLINGRSLPFIQRYVAGVVFIVLGLVASSAKIS